VTTRYHSPGTQFLAGSGVSSAITADLALHQMVLHGDEQRPPRTYTSSTPVRGPRRRPARRTGGAPVGRRRGRQVAQAQRGAYAAVGSQVNAKGISPKAQLLGGRLIGLSREVYQRPMETGRSEPLGWPWALLLSALAAAVCLGGCTTGSPISPVYTQADRKAECDRHRGWWRPDDLRGGYCEYDSQM